ncbi:hypothetical protein HELRODRAFT_186652 [Helobdella robusta]|uniref:Tubulin/FtsZ GTPase domain-containing protein n=1 Tax=Helobdella robusta TaxID=6412 RepID=T1FP19_HELRO|nr:hypothetical protein HELRODRAFT_186652 [Helobdella robusta]ESO10597.1 hypothetical protein HELRODRAFT_186652 [Helobdella robusta]
MTQSIVIQVGQCGNQIGARFWDLALKEHKTLCTKKTSSVDSVNSFFEQVDNERGQTTLKARAVLVDMEEGVVDGMTKSNMGSIFKHQQLIKDFSGSGNNWAVGHFEYGGKHDEDLRDCVRRAVETCDCLQCFFMLHSMGGGTGSGLGTYILKQLEDDYQDVYRFVIPIFPSQDDDVITSPYNAILALSHLTDHADCVLPIENQALSNIVTKISSSSNKLASRYGKKPQSSSSSLLTSSSSSSSKMTSLSSSSSSSATRRGCGDGGKDGGLAFDEMNNIVANMILNLTRSSRFDGSLNVDLNEITMNLVPYPTMHFILSSQSPLLNSSDETGSAKRLDSMFTEAYSPDHQMMTSDPRTGVFMACALLVRGRVELSDIRRNVDRLKKTLKFVHWNQDGWKTGLCSTPPPHFSHSLLSLSNNSSLWKNFQDMNGRFLKLYTRKV